MQKAQNPIPRLIGILAGEYPEPKTALNFETPYQLLVATILSAQCTDARVNLVTKDLFRRYPGVEAVVAADPSEFEQLILPTGFYRNKAKHILAASRMIKAEFGGEVPAQMEQLLRLPGVARKTANVVLAEAFRKQEGIAVDTHVIRLSRLLGLSASADPRQIERDLMAATPQERWGELSNLLILHGRRVCVARRPRCEICALKSMCPSARPQAE